MFKFIQFLFKACKADVMYPLSIDKEDEKLNKFLNKFFFKGDMKTSNNKI